MTDDLMNLEDIAALWRVSRDHARDRIVKLPGFPQPVPGCGLKNRLWLRTHVVAFLSGETFDQPPRITHKFRTASLSPS